VLPASTNGCFGDIGGRLEVWLANGEGDHVDALFFLGRVREEGGRERRGGGGGRRRKEEERERREEDASPNPSRVGKTERTIKMPCSF
jgi:hypothetical protein